MKQTICSPALAFNEGQKNPPKHRASRYLEKASKANPFNCGNLEVALAAWSPECSMIFKEKALQIIGSTLIFNLN